MLMFPPPEPPPAPVVQTQCEAVFAEQVTMAPKRVRDAHEKALRQADESGAEVRENPFDGRRDAIEERALALGAQSGMRWRYTQIHNLLDSDEIQGILDQAFLFSRMLTEDNVQYPVISQANESFSVTEDGQSARSSRVTWQIIQPARIVTVQPTWRTYLHQELPEIPRVPTALQPYDSDERALWQAKICDGFSMGVVQADHIFQDRMHRLVRDYTGMTRYRILATQGIVSEPRVAEGALGVQITSGGEKVHVDDRIIDITDTARFLDADSWEAIRSMNPEIW